MPGLTQSSSNAVINPSRPNGVLNHGMPAYGYDPCGVSVSIICRSALERTSQRLNIALELSTRQLDDVCEARRARVDDSAWSKAFSTGAAGGPSSAPVSYETLMTIVAASFDSSRSRNAARPASTLSGRRLHRT